MNQLMMNQSVAQWWDDFRKQTIPDVSSVQRREMRKAFYAGMAQVMLALEECSNIDLDDEVFAALFEQRYQEVRQFFEPEGGVYETH